MKKITITLISLSLGGAIYILWRDDTLLMFHWFSSLSISENILIARSKMAPIKEILPSYIIYTLPTTLWLFSGLMTFDLIWREDSKNKNLWLFVFFIFAIGSELLQAVKIVPGTFDSLDLLSMAVAGGVAILIINNSNRKTTNEH